MSISWSWSEQKEVKLFGSQAYETDKDFDTKSTARKAVDAHFARFECKNCGCRKLDGDNLLVELTFVRLYHYVTKKGLFGGEKQVEEHWKDVYRVGDIIFKNGGVFGGAGYIKCTNCKEKASGGNMFWGQWAKNMMDAKDRGEW